MFDISTYILKEKAGKENIAKDSFYPSKDCGCLQYIIDNQYISGMIEIIYYGEQIIGENEWDLVDQLWLYFINAFIQLKKQEYVEFYFPDQPLKVKMTDINGEYLIFEVGKNKKCFPKKIFIQEMIDEAKKFFSILNFQYGLEKIDILCCDIL